MQLATYGITRGKICRPTGSSPKKACDCPRAFWADRDRRLCRRRHLLRTARPARHRHDLRKTRTRVPGAGHRDHCQVSTTIRQASKPIELSRATCSESLKLTQTRLQPTCAEWSLPTNAVKPGLPRCNPRRRSGRPKPSPSFSKSRKRIRPLFEEYTTGANAGMDSNPDQ